MSSNTDEPESTLTYELTCTDCGYETTVDGNVYKALDVAKAHREKYGVGYTEHFMDFELSDRTD